MPARLRAFMGQSLVRAESRRTNQIPSRHMSVMGAGHTPLRAAELVLVNGKIRTPEHPSGFAQAMAVGGGIVRALGSDDDIRALIGPFTRVVDLRGRLAIPAFGDAHIHPVQ